MFLAIDAPGGLPVQCQARGVDRDGLVSGQPEQPQAEEPDQIDVHGCE